MLENKKINEYVVQLGSKEPVPGGGSVASLSAALGSALNCMVFSLTVGKKAFEQLDNDEKKLIIDHYKKSQILQKEFMNLMNKDAEVFMEFMKIFKLPKNTENEKKVREYKLQEGYRKALQIPLNTLEKSEALYEYILTAAKYGSKTVISDAGVAVLMLHAALESSIINIKINLKGLKDEAFKEEILAKCNKIKKVSTIKKEKIMSIVENRI